MYTFALRCPENHYPAFLAQAQDLGIIRIDDGRITAPNAGAWDLIGTKPLPGGGVLLDQGGSSYIHINLITPVDLVGTPLMPWVLTDAITGRPTLPQVPIRVFL